MPKSPKVTFDVTNNNIASIEPQLGIGFVVARTTKGKFFDPSTLINTPSQFKELFGSEVVPDGSLSNIERALSLGAKVRVCRVGHLTEQGNLDAVKGKLVNGTLSEGSYVAGTGDTLEMVITGYEANPISIKFKFETKEYGGDIFSTNGKFTEVFTLVGNRVIGTLYNTNNASKLTDAAFLVDQATFANFQNGTASKTPFFDVSVLKNFINSNKYLVTTFVEAKQGDEVSTTITNLEEVYQILNRIQAVKGVSITFQQTPASSAVVLNPTTPLYYLGTVGNAGSKPTADDWKKGLQYARDYNDYYDMFCSHLAQHLDSAGALAVHQEGGALALEMKNTIYDVEIPKVNTDKDTIIASREEIGLSDKHVAYFAGGLRLYNSEGTLTNCDVLGTVLGLSATSATQFAPWYSFAGQNRGIVGDAHGPVAVNYGGIGNYQALNEIALKSINIFVIKEKALGGKATMLWHNFTSSLLDDSERFLNVERLVIYLKKTIRPIMERYLEEPNTFSTWSNMYLEIAPLMENVENGNGVSEWEWIGDQNATSFDDLEVNNENDVRQGKYKAILRIKDVVALQEIAIEIVIDSSTGSVSVA